MTTFQDTPVETVDLMDQPISDHKEPTKRRKKIILIAIIVIAVIILAIIAVFVLFSTGVIGKKGHGSSKHEASKKYHQPEKQTKKRVTFNEWKANRLLGMYHEMHWSPGTDMSYLLLERNNIYKVHLNGSRQSYVLKEHLPTLSSGEKFFYFDYLTSPDEKYVLLLDSFNKKWRYSRSVLYWIFDRKTRVLLPLMRDKPQTMVDAVQWSPTGHALVYSYKHDLYYLDEGFNSYRLTHDGSTDIYNGLADWIYEEEVFMRHDLFWWSPDSKYLAFTRIDDTNVKTYYLQYHTNKNPLSMTFPQYPKYVNYKYPKVGTTNPKIELYIVNLKGDRKPVPLKYSHGLSPNDTILTGIFWISNTQLLIQQTNRISNYQETFVYDMETKTYKATYVRGYNATKEYGGWIEPRTMSIVPIKVTKNDEEKHGYLSIQPYKNHYHIAYYETAMTSNPTYLTVGSWSVTEISSYDPTTHTVYFMSTMKNSMERHLYKVNLFSKKITALTDVNKRGYYSVSFHSTGKVYFLSYLGPDIPYQEIRKVDNETFVMGIENNYDLSKVLDEYNLPMVKYYTVKILGREMNFKVHFPPDFDDSGKKKYPVLFYVYGGPNSQYTAMKYESSWHVFLASEPSIECIVVTVDGRGTGYRGLDFASAVYRKLGVVETEDQIEAAKYVKTLPYVDPERFGIWGWSYGGFIALKVLEKAPDIFPYGLAVAPLVDPRLYDSIYTERYMGLPHENPKGYKLSTISKYENLAKVKRFMLMHGTGDDNVHIAHTYNLIDELMTHELSNYDMHVYPDSPHSMGYHNARDMFFRRMAHWWRDAFNYRWNQSVPLNKNDDEDDEFELNVDLDIDIEDDDESDE